MFGEHELNWRNMLQTKMFSLIPEAASCLNIKTDWPSTYCHFLKTEVSNHPLHSKKWFLAFLHPYYWYLQCRDHVIPSDTWSISISSSSNVQTHSFFSLKKKEKVFSHCSQYPMWQTLLYRQTLLCCGGALN